jgi:hypothetical protein
LTGNFYEPDFDQFKKKLLEVYNNLTYYKKIHLDLSNKIQMLFSLENSAKKAMDLIFPYLFKSKKENNEFYVSTNNVKKLSFNGDTQNDMIYKEIFEYEVYNNIPQMKIKKGDVVLDIGSHIGIFSRYANVNGASRVISIEMDPSFFLCLKQNSNPTDDIFNCVLFNKNLIKFKVDNDLLINGFTLDHFYNGGLFEKLDFIKIDICGNEKPLLESFSQNLYNVINKISLKVYNISDTTKSEVIHLITSKKFNNFFNILLPNQPIQFLYFWK